MTLLPELPSGPTMQKQKVKPQLPEVTEAVAYAVATWIQSHEEMQRTPVGTAKILTLVVLLHRKKLPWPTRQDVADHLGVSRPLVDMVISQRSATGHVEVMIKTKRGFVARRPSVVRERYIVPSDEIIQAVTEAERLEKNAKRRMTRRVIVSVAGPIAMAMLSCCESCGWWCYHAVI